MTNHTKQEISEALTRLDRLNEPPRSFSWGDLRNGYEVSDTSAAAELSRKIELLAARTRASAISKLPGIETSPKVPVSFNQELYSQIEEVYLDTSEQRAWTKYLNAIEALVNAINAA
jgi:hypothetical protein